MKQGIFNMYNQLKPLSTVLRTLRLEQNLTQKQMGDIIGVSPQSISGFENGSIIPDLRYLCTYSDYFHIQIRDMFVDGAEPIEKTEVEDLPTSSEMQMIKAYRRRPEWMRKVIRSLCFNGTAYRSQEEEIQEILAIAEKATSYKGNEEE